MLLFLLRACMPSARAHARLTSTGVIAAPEQDVVAGSLAEQARGSSACFVQQDRRRPLRQEREPRRGVCAGRLLTRSLSMARGSARRGSGCLGVLNNVPRCRPPPPPSSSSTSCTKHAWRHALCAPVLLCQNGHRRGTTVLEFQCGGTAGELLDEDLHRQPRPRRSAKNERRGASNWLPPCAYLRVDWDLLDAVTGNCISLLH